MNPKKEFIEYAEGINLKAGRPIYLHTLTYKKDLPLSFIGDVHLGYKWSKSELFKKDLEYCKENNHSIVLMGDLLEIALPNSPSNEYEQILSPQEQIEEMIEMLKPYKKNIIGMLDGNHEQRVVRSTGVNPTKIMADALETKYYGETIWLYIKVKKQRYNIFALHGWGGGKTKSTKMNGLIKTASTRERLDLAVMGHKHSAHKLDTAFQYISHRNKQVQSRTMWHLLTPAYIQYEHSYGEKKYPMSRLGMTTVMLTGDKPGIDSEDISFRLYE